MPETSSPAPDAPSEQVDLLTQLVTGPSIREVATNVLLPALKTLYPHLSIDPRLTTVVTPSWSLDDAEVEPGPRYFESLTGTLVRHAELGTPVVYLEGEHYLTRHPMDQIPAQLPVSIEAIGRLLNELVPVFFLAFQEQQVDYWNRFVRPSTPRWQGLSRSLRECWNIADDPDWDDDRRAMARSLFEYPDKTTRSAHDRFQCRACLIDMDYIQEGLSTHYNILDMAVLTGTVGTRTVIITHTIVAGFQTFDSLQTLGESLRGYTQEQPAGSTVNWRLIEPTGNYFDHLACNLIALQADWIGSLTNNPKALIPNLTPHVDRATGNLSPGIRPALTRFHQVEAALPHWLDNATPADLSAYSRHLMDLAVLQGQQNGQSFDDGIKPIRAYAEEKLRAAMIHDHADARDLDVAAISIDIESPVVWGSFLPPVPTEHTRLSLIDLALQNLIAMPTGNKTLSSSAASTLPTWLTVDYVQTLIARVDIGKTYPALIKNRLFDDPLESLRRQNLFTARLRIELPLLALQQKIRAQNGVNGLGYRYVTAAMQVLEADRRVDGQEIVIRPLALRPGWRFGGSTDEVTNMFVIGPREMDKGPCLLYRPMLDQPLSQHPTPANLIYAIRHYPDLRKSVLAWLPENVRTDYANHVFPGELPSVWSLSQMLADPLTSLQMSGPLSLGMQVIGPDYLASLYKANVNALIELAQQQSLSNARNRWETFKQAAWLILSAALPFFGETVGTAAWIWQVLDDLQQTLDAGEAGHAEQQKSAMTDLLLTLAMVLAHRAATRHLPVTQIPEKQRAKVEPQTRPPTPVVPATLLQLPDVVGESAIAPHRTSVATDATLSLEQTLERFRIVAPEHLTPPAKDGGLYQYLHSSQNRFYAQVGERWFEVTVEDTGEVSLIDSRQQPPRRGPRLIGNRNAEWFVDTRLRLRGGGMSSRRKALKLQNQQRIAELKTALAQFNATRASTRDELTGAYNRMKDASDNALPALQTQFLEKLEQRTTEYDVPIEQLKALNLIDTVPTYRVSMTEMLGTQLFFNQTWFDQKKTAFAQCLMETLTLLEAEEHSGATGGRATYQRMIDLSEEMIGKIEFAQSRLQELSRLGRDAAQIAVGYKTSLPAYSPDDLKALEVSLAREVCLPEGDSPALIQARDELTRMLDTSSLAIQTSQELIPQNSAWSASERIEALNGLLEQFTAIDQLLEDFAITHQKRVLASPFALLSQRISEFHQQTEACLAQLVREQPAVVPPIAATKAAPASRKRVIKTRFKGTVVGEVRDATPDEPVLLDVRAPLTGQVIATFHEKSPGVWLERVTKNHPAPTTSPASLETQLAQGKALLDELEPFIRRTETSSRKPGRLPVEIEELFHHKAEEFGRAARLLEQMPLRTNSTDSPAAGTTALINRLNGARDRLHAEGQRLRIEMIMQQPPTAPRVEWLLSKNAIDIVPSGTRRRLKGPRKDYLQEYEIRERSNGQTLWYAHFHYASPDSPMQSFTAAHLKLRDQRLLAGAFDVRTATSNPQVITIYRSEISPALARTLFFSRA